MQQLQQQQIAAQQYLQVQKRNVDNGLDRSLQANTSLKMASSLLEDIRLQEDIDLNQHIKL